MGYATARAQRNKMLRISRVFSLMHLKLSQPWIFPYKSRMRWQCEDCRHWPHSCCHAARGSLRTWQCLEVAQDQTRSIFISEYIGLAYSLLLSSAYHEVDWKLKHVGNQGHRSAWFSSVYRVQQSGVLLASNDSISCWTVRVISDMTMLP